MVDFIKSLQLYLRHRVGKKDTKQIEVFDVLLRSKMRLQLFDLKFGDDVLLNQQVNPYLETMKMKFGQDQPLMAEEDSVYLTDQID